MAPATTPTPFRKTGPSHLKPSEGETYAQGRDHIWAYYTRNLVRPIALSRAKVDVIIGNPPWIIYNQTTLTPKGQFGARHLHKHLWKLPIPEYNPAATLHAEIAQAEYQQRQEAWQANNKRGRQPNLTVTIARRELRQWLRASPEGAAAETAVTRLLAGGI